MIKKALLLILTVFALNVAKAQTAEDVYNQYLDFNLARLQSETAKALDLGEKIVPDSAKLTAKARTNFYFSIGNLYENDNQTVLAQKYYERVAAAVPNYYVVRRALGYIYAKKAEEIADQITAAKGNATETNRLTILYNNTAKKALAHLEKAQACDPDDDTLSRIKTLYNNIKDQQGLATLNSRLAALAKNCIDLLDDK